MIIPLYTNTHHDQLHHHHEKHTDNNDILKEHLASLDYQTGICIALAMFTGLLALVAAINSSDKTIYPVATTALLSGAAIYTSNKKNAFIVQHCLNKKTAD